MKTPRDILLERHQSAEPKLDAIRHRVLAAERGETPAPAGLIAMLWRELIAPSRVAWGGLAAVWVVILGLNALSGEPRAVIRTRAEAPSADVQALRRQQQLLWAELMEPKAVANRPAPDFAPRPRSESPPLRREQGEARFDFAGAVAQLV